MRVESIKAGPAVVMAVLPPTRHVIVAAPEGILALTPAPCQGFTRLASGPSCRPAPALALRALVFRSLYDRVGWVENERTAVESPRSQARGGSSWEPACEATEAARRGRRSAGWWP